MVALGAYTRGVYPKTDGGALFKYLQHSVLEKS